MESKDLEQKARIIVNRCLCKPSVSVIMNKLYNFDRTTFTHSSNVAYLATQMALYDHVDETVVKHIAMGGLLHDVGKMAISLDILNKNGPLTESEYAIVKKHSADGYAMIKNFEISQEAKEIVLKHHERIDGSGYPLGLKDKDIPWYVKYVSVCDVYDAMTSPRPYKFPFMSDYALNEIGRYAGVEFDKDAISKLIKCMKNI